MPLWISRDCETCGYQRMLTVIKVAVFHLAKHELNKSSITQRDKESPRIIWNSNHIPLRITTFISFFSLCLFFLIQLSASMYQFSFNLFSLFTTKSESWILSSFAKTKKEFFGLHLLLGIYFSWFVSWLEFFKTLVFNMSIQLLDIQHWMPFYNFIIKSLLNHLLRASSSWNWGFSWKNSDSNSVFPMKITSIHWKDSYKVSFSTWMQTLLKYENFIS